MADKDGFLTWTRQPVPYRPMEDRIRDYREVEVPHPPETLQQQASRCMDCGIPFCHNGCTLHNCMPEFNDLVYRGRWKEASEVLHETNNFPEITGRVCPALCEASCTLNIDNNPVLIRHVEFQVAERAFSEGWVKPLIPSRKTGKRVAIVGSGPAGLATAQQLARAGHDVVVFEKSDRIGGLLRYGIPDFKMEKSVIDRRLDQMRAEGVKFETGVFVGEDLSARYLSRSFDAVCLAMGAGKARPFQADGADLDGVHFALDFLTQQNRAIAGDSAHAGEAITAGGKSVVVIGGGDTGSDCVGTSIRQGAKEVHQFEILPKPPQDRPADTPWPMWPRIMRTSSSHLEGCLRRWAILTKSLTGTNGSVKELHGIEVDWVPGPEGMRMVERTGTAFSMKADLVLLALGFLHVEHSGLVDQFGLELDPRGNIRTDDFMTSEPGVFAAGDAMLGASLVVHAINAGRHTAARIDRYLESGE